MALSKEERDVIRFEIEQLIRAKRPKTIGAAVDLIVNEWVDFNVTVMPKMSGSMRVGYRIRISLSDGSSDNFSFTIPTDRTSSYSLFGRII